MATTEASLAVRTGPDGITYVALHDVAGLLHATAATLDGTAVPASDAMRSLATGLANYEERRN